MKKCMKVFAMVLVLALALSMTAVAAAPGDKPTITPTPGPVTFTDDTCKIMNVSFTNAAIQNGKDYMIWVIAADSDGNYIPTASSILYIGQATASGTTFTFNGVYPKEIVDGAVMLSGPGLMDIDTDDGSKDGLYTLATIKIPYVLGDVNEDGKFSAGDALLVLQHSVKLITLTGNPLKAANVNGDSVVSSADALKILQRSVGLIGEF